jgi:hypothetical protein
MWEQSEIERSPLWNGITPNFIEQEELARRMFPTINSPALISFSS